MKDIQLAKEVVRRLNALIEYHEDVRKDISDLLVTKIPCSTMTANHPSIQVAVVDGSPLVGALGLLNGIIGIVDDVGPLAGYGYITAMSDIKTGRLDHFALTTDLPRAKK